MSRKRGTFEGTTEPLPSGRVRVRMRVAGRLTTIDTFDTSAEAEAYRETMSTMRRRSDAAADCVDLASFGRTVLDDRELAREIEDVDSERGRWRTHVEGDDLGRIAVRAVEDVDVREWLGRLLAKGRARSTRLNTLNVLRTVMNAAIDRKLHAGPNPCAGLRLRKEKRTELPWTYLTPEEQDALIAATPKPLDGLVEFAIGTGLRAGELVTLRLADVHVDGADPHIVVRYGKPPAKPTKTGKIRHVPLFGRALAAMVRWLEALPTFAVDPKTRRPKNPHGLAFPGAHGSFRSRAHVIRWAMWRGVDAKGKPGEKGYRRKQVGIVERAGIARDVRWHDLRHTCASSLVCGWWGRTWTLAEVSEMLGHASVTTTERYAHLADTVLKKAAREGATMFHASSTVPVALAEIPSNLAGATLGNRTPDLRFTNAAETEAILGALVARGTLRGTSEELLRAVASNADVDAVRGLELRLAREVLASRAVTLAGEVLAGGQRARTAALELADLGVASAEQLARASGDER